MKKNFLKIIGVILGLMLSLNFFTKLLTPTWYDWNNDNTMKGIYKEPRNRLQVLFLGSSLVINGISPMYLYDQYGISAYNMGTQMQSMLTSYYWLKEIYRFQSGTLQTVVMDTSALFAREDENQFVEKSLAVMKFSPIKAEAIAACARRYADFSFSDHIFPIIAYHSRWKEVSEDDFSGLTDEKNSFFTRGQNITFRMAANMVDPAQLYVPDYTITPEREHTAEEHSQVWNENEKAYLDKIAGFCREHQISLVLTSLIRPNTNDLRQDAIHFLAEEYGIPVIDFNQTELQEELGLQYAYDYLDNRGHANVYGAQKVTGHIGKFLAEHCPAEDIRGKDGYAYLEEQAEGFSVIEENMALHACNDLENYLSLIGKDRYTVFLSVKDEAFAGLSDRQKEMLTSLGFSHITQAEEGSSYIGAVSLGKALADEAAGSSQESVAAEGIIDRNGRFSLLGIYRPQAVTKSLSENSWFVSSSKTDTGERASVIINGTEYSLNRSGMNFVIYDNELKKTADAAAFSTHEKDTPRVRPELPEIYLARLEEAKHKADSGE